MAFGGLEETADEACAAGKPFPHHNQNGQGPVPGHLTITGDGEGQERGLAFRSGLL